MDALSQPMKVYRNKETGAKVGIPVSTQFLPDNPCDWERLADNESVTP